MEGTPSVHQFTDYRTFLIAHAQDKKKVNPRWTYGLWAKQLGLKATSSITKIIQGDRDPGDHIIKKFIHYFKFYPKQAEYFCDLVRLHKIKKDPRLSVLLMEKMSQQLPEGAFRLLDDKAFRIVSHWYYFVLREMAGLDHFIEDPTWISKKLQFKVTPREIKNALKILLEKGFLKRDKQGGLYAAQGRINTTDDIASEAIKRHHEQMLDNSKKALRQVGVEEREFTSSSLVLKTSKLTEAKKYIREFKQGFSKLFEDRNGDAVYQIQIQFFPLTKPFIKKEEK